MNLLGSLRAGRRLGCAALLALVCGTAGAAGPPARASRVALVAQAETLFAEGRFAAADTLYAQLLARTPRDTLALKRRGAVALFHNRVADARRWYEQALARDPANRGFRRQLAECHRRADRFADAARLERGLGREQRALQLESFAGRVPYRADARTAEVAFVQTDPLPVIQVSVNGSAPVFFIIDTGGADLVLDTEFADSVKARRFGADSATFAAGQRGRVEFGAVDSVSLGGLTVRDVPVEILSTRKFSGAAGGRRVDGIIGTVFLYHFLPTLDYPAGKLVLRPRDEASRRDLDRSAAEDSAWVVPFWMSGDHYMVARGTINGSEPLLWFVDTGLAGAGFTCPASTLADAGIDLAKMPSFEGTGGAGKVKVTPFSVDSLTLGPAAQRGVTAFFGPFPPTLERGMGYRIGGIISHGFLRRYRMTMDFDGMRYLMR
ncbi:MAG TPA: aspartyl protease family protein [Candidatus Eisenbacteria bacterium]|nr:aspartyl protease family protein [Candidatus Eisenbacteria bacterium]